MTDLDCAASAPAASAADRPANTESPRLAVDAGSVAPSTGPGEAGAGGAGAAEAIGSRPVDPSSNDPSSNPVRIERPYRIRFEEVSAAEELRTAVLLGYVQDCAWQHSTLLGVDRPWYSERDMFWLVKGIRLDVLRRLPDGGDVSVSTQVLGFRRVAARRLSEVRDSSGDLLARVEIDWVMVSSRGVPVRVPFDFGELFGAREGAFEMRRVPLPEPAPDAVEHRFAPHRRDLDPLDHVNNSVYLDYLEEALEAAAGREQLVTVPRRYDLEYLAPADRSTELVSRIWSTGSGAWAYRLDRGDGATAFRARIEIGEIDGE